MLLDRCLRKDPRQRLHDAADVRIEIDDVSAGGEAVVTLPPQTTANRFLPMAIGLAAGLAIASTFWWLRGRSSDKGPEPQHLSVSLASDAVPAGGQTRPHFAISPDGRWVVYTVVRAGKPQLFLRAIQEVEGKLINGTEGAIGPFFSPDSQWIGFGSGKELKKVPVSGGSPAVICSCVSDNFSGAWGSDSRIIFVPDWNLGIWSVSADGGMPQLLLKTDEGRDLIAYSQLVALPDGRGILLTIASGQTMSADDEKIAILESGATEPRILIQGGSHASYLSSGHLVYSRGGALLSVAFDLSRLAVAGTPASVIEGIERGVWDYSHYSVSQNGTLIYEPTAGVQGGGRFAIVDRKGNVQPINERRGNPSEFSLSSDGKHIAARLVAVNDDIWTYDVATGTPLRFTAEPSDEVFPQWTPDGTRIAFGTRTGKIFWKPADGSGQREELSHGEYPRRPGSFSPDGKTLAFVELHPSRQGDIWLMPLDGDRKAQPLLATDANEVTPKFSPDGHWLAYVSNETGRDEIYVRPIGTAGGRKRVSTEGGTSPAWARTGKELFFVKGDKLASVTLDAQANPAGRDRVILDAPKLDDLVFQEYSPMYDVMPDGEHFVMLLSPRYPPPTHYNVVINWFEELKRKANR
jgi:serine/threonine-protein kinase